MTARPDTFPTLAAAGGADRSPGPSGSVGSAITRICFTAESAVAFRLSETRAMKSNVLPADPAGAVKAKTEEPVETCWVS